MRRPWPCGSAPSQAWRARGDLRRAAYLAAYQIAFDHLALFGNQAVAQGWLERGAHLVDEAGECAEAGWVALSRALHTSDPAARAELVGEATASRGDSGTPTSSSTPSPTPV